MGNLVPRLLSHSHFSIPAEICLVDMRESFQSFKVILKCALVDCYFDDDFYADWIYIRILLSFLPLKPSSSLWVPLYGLQLALKVFVNASTLTCSTLCPRVNMLLKTVWFGFPLLRHLTVLWPCSPAPWPELTALEKKKKQPDQEVITLALLSCCDSRVDPVMRSQTPMFPAVFHSLKKRTTPLT